MSNAINQTIKEVRQRFDFKGSAANVVLEKESLLLTAEDDTKLRNMNDILQQKLVRRGVPLKALNYGTVEPAAVTSPAISNRPLTETARPASGRSTTDGAAAAERAVSK